MNNHQKQKNKDSFFEECTIVASIVGIILLCVICRLDATLSFTPEGKSDCTSKICVQTQPRQEIKKFTRWDKLRTAIIAVESEGKLKAVNGNCVGVLQISPVYVDQCNKILGYNKYKLRDRYDSLKSIEMFELYQNHFNVYRDESKAIKIHNPKAGNWYRKRVLQELDKINSQKN